MLLLSNFVDYQIFQSGVKNCPLKELEKYHVKPYEMAIKWAELATL